MPSLSPQLYIKGLQRNRYIESVDLSGLLFTIDDWNAIVAQVEKDVYIRIINLSIAQTSIALDNTNIELEQLGRLLAGPCLTELHIGKGRNSIVANMQLGLDCAKLLAGAIKSHATLEYIILFGNKLGDAGAQVFAEALVGTQCLARLDLSTAEELA